MATDCLLPLLGLAAAAVRCFPFPEDAAEQAAITASTTGLYLADAEGLPTRPASTTGTATDFYDRLAAARRAGVADIRSQLTKALRGKYTLNAGTQGNIGRSDWGATNPATGEAALTLHTKDAGGAALRVSHLNLLTDTPVLGVVVTLDGEPVGTISTNQGGQAVAFTVPLDGLPHVLRAELPAEVRTRANKFCCGGCGGCTPLAPYLHMPDTTAGGFALTATIGCDPAQVDLLCFAATGTDADLTHMLGQAILFASARAYCISLLTDTAGASRYTALQPDQLKDVALVYESKVAEHVAWLASSQALGGLKHPCYSPAPAGGPSIGKTYGG